MLDTTWSNRIVSPASVTTPVARPPSWTIRATPQPGRQSTPSSEPSDTSAFGTARVPPIGYQTPSLVCMCAIEHSTAGEPYGLLPTYCTKWSSICETRASGTCRRIWPATVLPIFSASTSRSVPISMFFFKSIVSSTSSTDRQKKNFSLTPCSFSLNA